MSVKVRKYYGDIEVCATCGTGQLIRLRDGMIRKHKREVWEGGQWTGSHEHCPGSGQPHIDLVADNNAHAAQTEPQEIPVARFTVNQLGPNLFAVRDNITELDASTSTSRYGAQYIADALADGTMVINSLGKAVAAQAPAKPTTVETGEFGVFDEDGECIDGPYYTRESAEKQAQTHRDEDRDGEYTVRDLCPDHEGQAKDNCHECFAEDEN